MKNKQKMSKKTKNSLNKFLKFLLSKNKKQNDPNVFLISDNQDNFFNSSTRSFKFEKKIEY